MTNKMLQKEHVGLVKHIRSIQGEISMVYKVKQILLIYISFAVKCEKTCLQGFTNNKGTDQPALMGRLISSFVIRIFESIISRLATSEISIF